MENFRILSSNQVLFVKLSKRDGEEKVSRYWNSVLSIITGLIPFIEVSFEKNSFFQGVFDHKVVGFVFSTETFLDLKS